jgi:phosphoribosylaminoimidazole-succinocarboxamide synthase
MPVMPDEFVNTITERYIELYEKVTGKQFVKNTSADILADIEKAVLGGLG